MLKRMSAPSWSRLTVNRPVMTTVLLRNFSATMLRTTRVTPASSIRDTLENPLLRTAATRNGATKSVPAEK